MKKFIKVIDKSFGISELILNDPIRELGERINEILDSIAEPFWDLIAHK